MLARVAEALAPAPEPDKVEPVLQFGGGYRFDLAGHALVDKTGREVPLTSGEFGLLRAFVQRPERVLTRDQLLQILTGRDAEAYDRSIDMQIVRLRRKIELDPKRPRLIVTIPGSGYKFAAKVTAEADRGAGRDAKRGGGAGVAKSVSACARAAPADHPAVRPVGPSVPGRSARSGSLASAADRLS